MNSFDASVYKARRAVLKKKLGAGKIFLFGNNESSINFKDNWYPFRQDSTLLYYCGINIPGLHLMIDIDRNKEVIYGNELTIDDIIWTGPLPKLSELAEKSGIHEVRSLNQLFNDIGPDCHYLPPYRPEHSLLLSELLGMHVAEVEKGISQRLIDVIITQRNIKEEREVNQMSLAVDYSYDMHRAVMKGVKPGMFEHDLVGFAYQQAYRHNVHLSYPAILTKRGEVLHNHNHDGRLGAGDIVLFDGGCESELFYAGDITRTFPVSGKWDGIQKELYDVVYKAYKESVASLKPGKAFVDIHLLACTVLSQGLTEMGLMKGDPEEAVEQGAHTLFFQCGLGHLIGLDVHDMENLGEQHVGYGDGIQKSQQFGLKSLRLGRKIKPGYTLTIEPGIYIIPALIQQRKSQGLYRDFINYDLLEKHLDFGGIRLEDNFLITESGSELLGSDVTFPKTSKEVIEFMREV